MALKYYQFDYAEMIGFEVKNLGVLNIESSKSITREHLKDYTRQYLKQPSANIVISNITKLTKTEYEQLTRKN